MRFQRRILPGFERFRGRADGGEMLCHSGPVIRPAFQDRQPATGQILLMAKVFVSNHEEVKPTALGRGSRAPFLIPVRPCSCTVRVLARCFWDLACDGVALVRRGDQRGARLPESRGHFGVIAQWRRAHLFFL
jgi:hypothetical protein